MLPDTKAQQPVAKPPKIPKAVDIVNTPSGTRVSSTLINNKNIKGMFERSGYLLANSPDGQKDLVNVTGQRGYWENPYRIARYHDYIRSQTPGWKPPQWLNVQAVEAAYKYMSLRNENKPWSDWKYLPEDDEANTFLKGLATPPVEFLFPKEIAELKAKQRADEEKLQSVGSWEQLKQGSPIFGIKGAPSWQTVAETLTTPQPINQVDQSGRPLSSKMTANVLRAATTGLGGYAIGAGAAKLAAIAIAASGGTAAVPIAAIAALGATAFFLAGLYQNMTGKEAPVLGGAISAQGKVFNALAQGTEQTAGVIDQVIDEDNDTEEVLQNLLPAWQASYLNYETNQQNLIYNALAKLSGDQGTKPGEVYRLDLGMKDPQKLPEGIKYGVEALNDMREKIEAGADPQQVYDEYNSAFGASGFLNDFVLQSVFDPLNVAPALGSSIMSKVAGAANDASLAKAFPKPTASNWVVEALPFPLNMAAPLVSGGKWQGAPSVLDGIRKYKVFVQTGFMPGVDGVDANYKPPADYSNLQKTLGELDPETGMPVYFKPTEQPKGAVPKFLSWLFNLTPDAKARVSQANLMDHLQRVLETASKDPEAMTKLVKAMGEVDPKMAGDALGAILNPPGEAPIKIDKRFFNSPIGTAFGVAVKNLVESGKVDELFLAKWQAPAQKRAFLWKAAELMGITPGELLARLNKDADIAGTLKMKAQAAGIEGYDGLTNAGLKDLLGVFTGKDSLPWHPDLYRLELMRVVDDALQDFMVKRFDLKPDSQFLRVAHVMKNVQSMLVLGLNPAYLINNAINNIITRSATGVLGFMTPSQISDLLKRNDIEPYRPDAGLKKFGLAAEYEIDDIGESKKFGKVKQGEKDLISKANSMTGKLSDKIGFIKSIAGALERSESRQAYTIAFRQMQNNLWQPGIGFRKLPTTLEIELDKLDPEIKNRLYSKIRNAANPGEVDAAVFDASAPLKVDSLIDELAQALADKHNIIIKDPAIYKELLVNTGIADELNAGLSKAKNANDIDVVFDNVLAKTNKYTQKLLNNEIKIRVEDIRNRISQGGLDEAISVYTDMVIAYKKEWVKHFIEIEEMQRNNATLTPVERNKAWRSQNAMDTMRFEDLNSWESATYKGVFEALGQSNNPKVKEFLKTYEDTHANWNTFYKQKNAKFNKIFAEDYKTKDWNTDFDKVSDDIAELSARTYAAEELLQLRADQLFAEIIGENGGDAYKAEIGRTAMRVVRQEMTSLMNKFRKELRDNPPTSKSERLARWNEFINEVYIPKINELKRIEMTAMQAAQAAKPKIYYSDAVKQAFKDYNEGKAYWDGNNNFRLKDNKRAHPAWNAEVKKEFGSGVLKKGMDDFVDAAKRSAQGDDSKIVFGENPGKKIPIPMYEGRALSELGHDYIAPMVDTLRSAYKAEFESGRKLALDGVPEHLQAEVRQWLNGVKSDMPASKLASMKYAEEMRDYALLNYQKQTGLDQAMSVVFPYQFWYTHTMMNWAMRSLEKPNLYSWYYRYRQMQERLEKDGIPARLRGKTRINAPYLPEWMGGGLWSDPMRQLFPFSQFMDPVDRIAQSENSAKYKAFDILDEQVKNGELSKQEAEAAKNTMQGAIWEQAFTAAMNDSDLSDPMTLTSMLMQPGMYLTIPYYLATGQSEKIQPTPLLRYSKSIETALSGTGFDALGKGIGLLGDPEKNLREKVMTPAKAMFGEFGDYYIERNLTRMVADGLIGAKEAEVAMIDRSGKAYEEAMSRTRQELALRNPGILPILAVKGGASAPQVAFSVLNSLYPAGILPTGEVEMIGKGPEYSAAWGKYKLGDKEALTNFFNENPEFEARTALRAKPEERLHEYLVSEIYDRYFEADKANRQQINKQLGNTFVDAFLNKTTKNTDGISTETLATWAHILGGYVPQTAQPQATGSLDLWSPEVSADYQTYLDEKNQLFPNIDAISTQYFDHTPRNKKAAFLKQYPELKQYWAWNDDYKTNNPNVAMVKTASKNDYEQAGRIDINSLDPALNNQIMYAASTGSNLGPGAWMALQYQWEKMNKPYGDFQEWVDQEVLAQYK